MHRLVVQAELSALQGKRPKPEVHTRGPADQLKGYSLSSPRARTAARSTAAAAAAAAQLPQAQAAPEPEAEPQPAASDREDSALAAAVSAAVRVEAEVREAAGPEAAGSGDDSDAADVVHFPGAYQAFHRKAKPDRPAKPRPKQGQLLVGLRIASLLSLSPYVKGVKCVKGRRTSRDSQGSSSIQDKQVRCQAARALRLWAWPRAWQITWKVWEIARMSKHALDDRQC